MKRRSLLTAIAALPLASCSALPWIIANAPTIEAGVQDAEIILEDVARWVTDYLHAHPNADPEGKIAAAIQKASAALDGIARLLTAGTEVAQAQIQAAEEDFAAAWADLMLLVGPLGVMVAKPASGIKKSMRTADGGLVVPEPIFVSGGKS